MSRPTPAAAPQAGTEAGKLAGSPPPDSPAEASAAAAAARAAATAARAAAETAAEVPPVAGELTAAAAAALVLAAADLQAIGRHAERTYPEECCGFLLGQVQDGGGATRVERVVPGANERPDSRHNRFVMSPETVLAAHKEARAAGLSVVGYYHSHPDHPAEPSEFDREHAWPGLSYLIVSVRGGEADRVRSWRLRDDRERFEEEALAGAPPAAAGGDTAEG
jgi:proteasome lid subunit RPN8/RPN11